MAAATPNLDLILPNNGEFNGTWDKPLNSNSSVIDTAIGAIQDELVSAAGSATDLTARLAESLNQDGSLNTTTGPIADAQVSKINGADDTNSITIPNAGALTLAARLDVNEFETFFARGRLGTLVDGLAWGADGKGANSIVSGPGAPLTTAAGSVITLNGGTLSASTPVVCNINGYRQVVRVNRTVTISGAAGTKYITLTRNAAGNTYLPAAAANGVISTYAGNGLIAKFSDTTTPINFITSNVKAGDILTVAGVGQFVVYKTSADDPTNLATTDLAIIGEFDAAVSGLTYSLSDPIEPTLGFTTTSPTTPFTESSSMIYIGQVAWDGTSVTSALVNYAMQGKYAAWLPIPTSGSAVITFPHSIGTVPKRVQLFGSTANDFSAPLVPLTVAFLAGCVSAQVTNSTLTVNNFTNTVGGTYYYSYAGSAQTTGYIYAVVER